jgi:regulator of protease activity HflC (stomatin/prohibitin superfamily)
MNIANLFGMLAGAAWLGFLALLVVMLTRAGKGQGVKGMSTLVVVVLVVAIAFSTLGAGLVFIEPDELGVVITIGAGGIRPEPLSAGLHWVIPFIERVERYTILRQTYTMSSLDTEGINSGDDTIQVRTKDGQQVYIDASVIYAVDPLKAVDLYRTWRTNYQDGLVRPQARGVIRDVASQYGVEEIVSSQRAEMERQITVKLTEVFDSNNLVLQDFVLRNIRFSDEYATAVEQKQIAEQQAQQAKFVVESKKQEAEQARQIAQGSADAAVIAAQGQAQAWVIQAQAEAEARLIQAEAEAKSLKLIAEALADNPDLLTYQYITKLAPNIQVMLLPSNSPFLFPLPAVENLAQ